MGKYIGASNHRTYKTQSAASIELMRLNRGNLVSVSVYNIVGTLQGVYLPLSIAARKQGLIDLVFIIIKVDL